MKNKIIAVIGIIALSLIIINMSASHSKLNKSIDSKNVISMKTSPISLGQVYNFDYTGGEQTFEVPATGKYKIELWGASGNCGVKNNKTIFDEYGCTYDVYGAYTSGQTILSKDTNIYIYVGGAGSTKMDNTTISGGYNGGGSAFGYNDENNGSGGGATDIRLTNGDWNNFNSLKSRTMVAAGGAGKLGDKENGEDVYKWSPGGGLTSLDTSENKYGTIEKVSGATQTKPGNGLTDYTISGSFGIGANHRDTVRAGAGGGYYGGGISSRLSFNEAQDIIASGGSSFISGHNGCVAITEDSTEDNIKQRTDSNGKTCTDGTTDITCSYHYSGYKFTDTVMIDGAGYNWTTVKGDYVGQPQPDGTITTGHSGNGYARITYLGN